MNTSIFYAAVRFLFCCLNNYESHRKVRMVMIKQKDLGLRKRLIFDFDISLLQVKQPPFWQTYSQVQDEDVWHQLIYGIRYLDLR